MPSTLRPRRRNESRSRDQDCQVQNFSRVCVPQPDLHQHAFSGICVAGVASFLISLSPAEALIPESGKKKRKRSAEDEQPVGERKAAEPAAAEPPAGEGEAAEPAAAGPVSDEEADEPADAGAEMAFSSARVARGSRIHLSGSSWQLNFW